MPRDDPVRVACVIAESDAWTLIHVVIALDVILSGRRKGSGREEEIFS